MSPIWRHLVLGGLLILGMTGCSSPRSEREPGHQRSDESFTVRNSDDWGDAAGRVVNHVVAEVLP